MKKTFALMLVIAVLTLSACSRQENTAPDVSESGSAQVQTIQTATDNTKMPEQKTTTSGYESDVFITADKNTTKKTSKPNNNTTQNTYEMRINYKNLADFEKKVKTYKTYKDFMKYVDADKNNNCTNPFNQATLRMIFEDKKVFMPLFPDNCKFTKCSLSSLNFFYFEFTDKNKEKQSIVVYTFLDDSLSVNKFNLAFKSEQGVDIYKNKSKKYCWFLDDKYVVIYSGKDKDFINELYFKSIYIQ